MEVQTITIENSVWRIEKHTPIRHSWDGFCASNVIIHQYYRKASVAHKRFVFSLRLGKFCFLPENRSKSSWKTTLWTGFSIGQLALKVVVKLDVSSISITVAKFRMIFQFRILIAIYCIVAFVSIYACRSPNQASIKQFNWSIVYITKSSHNLFKIVFFANSATGHEVSL